MVFWFLVISVTLNSITFFQAKYPNVSIVKFMSLMAPVLVALNIGIAYMYRTGVVRGVPVWRIQTTFWMTQIAALAITAYVWFHEIPDWRTILAVGLVIISFILVST